MGLDEREYEYDEEDPKPALFMVAEAIHELESQEKEDKQDNLEKREEEYKIWLTERRKAYKPIPYWEELILYYSSGWDTIGLQFPYKKIQTVSGIAKATDLE